VLGRSLGLKAKFLGFGLSTQGLGYHGLDVHSLGSYAFMHDYGLDITDI